MNTRGDVLRDMLEGTGTSQGQLSRLTGVPQSRISNFINGRTGLSDDMLGFLLMPLGINVEHVWHTRDVSLTKHEQFSWEMHKRLSELLSRDTFPEWLPKLRSNVRRQRSSVRGEPHSSNVQRWSDLIENGDLPQLRRPMLDPTRDGVEMREVTPFVGLLPQEDRLVVLSNRERRSPELQLAASTQ